MRLVVVCSVGKVTTLAHQFAAQVRMRRKAIAAVQPEQVVDQQEFTDRNRNGQDAFAGLQRIGERA